jgi:hypothetical protein
MYNVVACVRPHLSKEVIGFLSAARVRPMCIFGPSPELINTGPTLREFIKTLIGAPSILDGSVGLRRESTSATPEHASQPLQSLGGNVCLFMDS